jgi:AcrR family transcriptional regulator
MKMNDQCAPEHDAREAISKYLALQYDFFMTYNRLLLSLARLLFADAIPEDWKAELNSVREKKLRLLASIIEKGIEQGFFIPGDSYRIARALRNIIRGFSIESVENKTGDHAASKRPGGFYKRYII